MHRAVPNDFNNILVHTVNRKFEAVHKEIDILISLEVIEILPVLTFS